MDVVKHEDEVSLQTRFKRLAEQAGERLDPTYVPTAS